jgi:hypothetical protein
LFAVGAAGANEYSGGDNGSPAKVGGILLEIVYEQE